MEDKAERRLLFIVRHGERQDEVEEDWEAIAQKTGERIFDPPLTETGKLQAIRTGERLAKEIGALASSGIDVNTVALLSSPFKRCMQTANEIVKILSKNKYGCTGIKVDEGLAEGGLAFWFPEGTPTFPNLDEKYIVDTSYRSHTVLSYPETVTAFGERYSNTVTHLVDAYNTETAIILVTHGYGIQFMTEALEPDAIVVETPYCSITKFVYHDPKWHLEYLADASHT